MAKHNRTDLGDVRPNQVLQTQTQSSPPAEALCPDSPRSPAQTIAELVDQCLDAGNMKEARRIISEQPQSSEREEIVCLEIAKARIAAASGDHIAAQAILLAALDRFPDSQGLRVGLTEIMLATGRATDIRSVLAHLPRSKP